ncbi:MAG TPA: ABC transporter permease subunit [Dehalococcoidia bacterium]|nr:ABC transporter permease subunit [Dehalococcoidia bacterium]
MPARPAWTTSALQSVGGWLQENLPVIVKLSSLSVLFIVWEVYARQQPNHLTISPFSDVVSTVPDLLGQSEVRSAFWDTLQPFFTGLGLALLVGIPIGLVLGQSPFLRGLLTPYLSFLNALPISAIVPLVVIGFGVGMSSRVTVVFLFAIVDIVLNSAAGVQFVRQELIEMSKSFGANRLQTFWRVTLPGSMPGVMTGVRLGTGRAIVGMVVVELLLVSVGVGRLISGYRGRFQTDELYAIVLIIAVLGVVLLEVVRRIEARVLHWRK